MSLRSRILAAMPLICTVAFLSIGFIWGHWKYAWMVFILVPLMQILLGRKKRLSLSFIITCIYLALGFIWKLWHPGWIIFLFVPIIHILVGNGENRIHRSYRDDD